MTPKARLLDLIILIVCFKAALFVKNKQQEITQWIETYFSGWDGWDGWDGWMDGNVERSRALGTFQSIFSAGFLIVGGAADDSRYLTGFWPSPEPDADQSRRRARVWPQNLLQACVVRPVWEERRSICAWKLTKNAADSQLYFKRLVRTKTRRTVRVRITSSFNNTLMTQMLGLLRKQLTEIN